VSLVVFVDRKNVLSVEVWVYKNLNLNKNFHLLMMDLKILEILRIKNYYYYYYYYYYLLFDLVVVAVDLNLL
jgi:hypothetical protein